MSNRNPAANRFATFPEKFLQAAGTGKDLIFYPNDETNNTPPSYPFTPDGLKDYIVGAGLPLSTFATRSDLSSAEIPYNISVLNISKYTAGGPIVNMQYSVNDTPQTSVDPTSLPINVVGIDGTTSVKYTKLITPKVTPAMMGAPLDGVTDDAVAINRCLTYFGNCYPDTAGPTWINYFIKTPVKFASSQVFDFRGWRGWMEVDLSVFTNTDYNTGVYSDLSTVFQMHGSTTGTDIPLDSITFAGARIRPKTTVLQRYTYVISARNVTNMVLRGNEITGFAAGVIIAINSCDGGRQEIHDNYIHDLLVNTTFPNGVNSTQMTGIQVDSDRAHSTKLSKKLSICNNRIRDFVTGSTTLSAYSSRQQDAINLTGQGDTFHLVEGNIINNVNQSIAGFGGRNSIVNNISDRSANAFHLVHGFSNNLVANNIATNCTLSGISMSSGTGEDCLNNKIVGNRLHVIGGDEYSGTWAAVTMEETGSGIINGNVFEGNTYECATATTVFYNQCITGRNISSGDTFMSYGTDTSRPVVIATASNKKLLQINKPVGGTYVKMLLSGNYTLVGATTTRQKTPFNTVDFDQRGEADATNSQVITKMPGWYTIRVKWDGINWTAGILEIFDILGSASDWGGSFTIYNAIQNWPTLTAFETYYLEFRAWFEQNATINVGIQHAATSDITIQSARSYLEIVKE